MQALKWPLPKGGESEKGNMLLLLRYVSRRQNTISGLSDHLRLNLYHRRRRCIERIQK
jgi:hypothetical protein